MSVHASTMPTVTEATVDIDQPSIRSYCIGITVMFLCMPGLIGNMLVSYVVFSKGLLTSNNSSMYNLSFNLIVADTVHLSVIFFYFGPAAISQSWLLPDGWTREIPGRLLMLCWHNMLIDLCLLGLNRYVTIFSKSNTKKMIILSWIAGFAVCVVGEQLVPCCSVYLYYKVYSYAFLRETGFNYNNNIIIIPINTFTSLFVLIAYSLVIYNIHANNIRVADKIAVESQLRRRAKEIKYAFQLIIISGVFVSVWITFNVLANSIPPGLATSGSFCAVLVMEIINASANSIVCIALNKEINGMLKEKFCCFCSSMTSVTITSVQPLTTYNLS